MWAVPVDALRVIVGLLSIGYFLQLAVEAGDISAPGGLVDHVLIRDVFWFTQLGLFQPWMGASAFAAAYGVAALAGMALALGVRPRLAAGFMFVVAVSALRWNFLVAYVEDAVIDLMLFWQLLLPIGTTLTVTDLRGGPRGAWRRWRHARVPGLAVGCLFANLALMYLVAGVWKWTSPMWRDGRALLAILQLPVSHFPQLWNAAHLPVLSILDRAAMAVETLAPLFLFLPAGKARGALRCGLIALHAGIVLTLKLPVANLACLAAVLAWPYLDPRPRCASSAPEPDRRGRFAVAFVFVLALSTARWPASPRSTDADPFLLAADCRRGGSVTGVHRLLYGCLWAVGISQEYQLFNWIDERNVRFDLQADLTTARGVEPVARAALIPDTNRGALLVAYLHGLDWLPMPGGRSTEFRVSLARRVAVRFFATRGFPEGELAVRSTQERLASGAPAGSPAAPELLFRAECRAGRIAVRALRPILAAAAPGR